MYFVVVRPHDPSSRAQRWTQALFQRVRPIAESENATKCAVITSTTASSSARTASTGPSSMPWDQSRPRSCSRRAARRSAPSTAAGPDEPWAGVPLTRSGKIESHCRWTAKLCVRTCNGSRRRFRASRDAADLPRTWPSVSPSRRRSQREVSSHDRADGARCFMPSKTLIICGSAQLLEGAWMLETTRRRRGLRRWRLHEREACLASQQSLR